MSSQPINVITISRGGAPVVTVTVTGMHQDHRPPRPSVGTPVTHGSTNVFQVTPGMLPNAMVTRGTSTALTQVHASGAYASQITSQQPNVDPASGRSPVFSPPAYPPSAPTPHLCSSPPQTAPSNPPYYRPSDNNRDRADPRGFYHYTEDRPQSQGTDGTPQADRARVVADPRVGAGTPPAMDVDRRGRYPVGPERFARGVPMARRYLDAAWGVTPGTKESLGLTD